MIEWRTDLERELLASACQRSFWHYMRLAYGLSHPENPEGGWFTAPVYKPMCDWLQGIVERWLVSMRAGRDERFFVLVDAGRNTAKSVVVTKGLTSWVHLREPNTTAVIDSVTMETSLQFADVIRNLWSGRDPFSYFTWLYGKWDGTEVWTRGRFNHKARTINRSECSVECYSVESGPIGRHPTYAVSDDLISIDKIREKGNWIELAKRHVDSFTPVLQNYSLYIIAGTPYTDSDVLTTRMREDGIREVCGHELPPEYKPYLRANGKWYMWHMPVANEDGVPLVPTRWSAAAIKEWRRRTPAEYASQGLLRPGSGEDVPLSMEQLEAMRIPRRDAPKRLTYTIHCDTAFKSRDRVGRGDDNVIEVWGHHPTNGDVFFLEAHGSNRWRIEHFQERLLSIVQRLRAEGKRIRWLTDEKTIGGKEGAWRLQLQSFFANGGMYLPPFLEINRSGDSKTARIREAAGYWVDGHVHLVEDAPGLEKLMWQMSRIGVSQKDDFADAAADVFHPEVYRPYRGEIEDHRPPEPAKPGDAIIRAPTSPWVDETRRLYDASITPPERNVIN